MVCKPYSVILLDEVEKAHPGMSSTFQAAVDDGQSPMAKAAADFKIPYW